MSTQNRTLRFIFFAGFYAVTLPATASVLLDEANSHFTYEGQSIHPMLIQSFANWISDYRAPMITTVDVAAAFESNRFGSIPVTKDDWTCVEEEVPDETAVAAQTASSTGWTSFCYRYIGRLGTGAHVVRTMESTTGSASFHDLYVLRFRDASIVWNGKRIQQLLMSVIASQGLGDRYDAEITLSGNRVLIPADKRENAAGPITSDRVIDFGPAATPAKPVTQGVPQQ